jgi:NTE family protein
VKKLVFLVFLTALLNDAFSQRIGLVMSGGGAAGLAHIGALKALEENGIPIDYITGTSAGALVGSMYVAGMNPSEMIGYALSDDFLKLAMGNRSSNQLYHYKNHKYDAGWIKLNFNRDFSLGSLIPTNVIDATLIDLEFLEKLSPVSAATGYNFDSLFVPYRCVAANVNRKSPIVFKEGHLSTAVRASMSFPFYLKPITVNGDLMFDGGLYNNFPTDVMYNDFFPDIIIGINVSDTIQDVANPDDVLSQLKTMIVNRGSFNLYCENAILIEPENTSGTFGFDKAQSSIEAGYKAAMLKMDEIKAAFERRVTHEELAQRRKAYRMKFKPVVVQSVTFTNVNSKQAKYLRKTLLKKDETPDLEVFRKRYFQLIDDDKIDFIYPIAKYDSVTGKYDLTLDVRKAKEFSLKFGGNFSSRPINTGYLGLEHRYFDRVGISTDIESYFGKFYSSGHLSTRIDFSAGVPFYIQPFVTLNRWDYFKSYATFFEEVKPSFLIQNESYWGVNVGVPGGMQNKVFLEFRNGILRDEYYQSENFTALDTTDVTKFLFNNIGVTFENNTLNRKLWANEGLAIKFKARYVFGTELNTPGSTSLDRTLYRESHEWFTFKLRAEKYFKLSKYIRLGIEAEGVYSTQDFFNNYTASALAAPAYQPIAESKTLFLPDFIAHQYVAPGAKLVIALTNNIDLRVEGYYFQPYQRIINTPNQLAAYGLPLDYNTAIGSASFVFNNPLGPVSITANYYSGFEEPWSVLFNFGYLLFNERGIK